MLSKRDNHNLRKTKEKIKKKKQPKNTSHAGQFHFDKRKTKYIKCDKEELAEYSIEDIVSHYVRHYVWRFIVLRNARDEWKMRSVRNGVS